MFKIAIGNVVQFPVKFTLREGSVDKLFSFTLTALRVTQSEIDENPERSLKDFLLETVTDWSGQRLVLTSIDEPAAFSKDALEYLLAQPGMVAIVWSAYQRQCWSKEKN
jgi:hypothetical protein